MKEKKSIQKESQKVIGNNRYNIYKCEKCGYESKKTFLNIFEEEEFRFCAKCVHKFYMDNFPKAILKK